MFSHISNNKKFISIFVLSVIFLGGFFSNLAIAQTADFSFSYVVSDPDAENGDILVSSDNGLVRATTIASNRLFGVLQSNPLIVLKTDEADSQPVATAGTALVNVTTIGGNISQGDFITSSTIPGKGQKLPGSGYVIGIAQANFDGTGADTITSSDGTEYAVGQIPIAVKIDYAEVSTPRSLNSFLAAMTNTLFSNLQNPEQFSQVVRYIAAGLIMFLSFIIGFFTFSRAIPKGVEAIGRNPLAKSSIYISIILNIIFTIITTGIGVIAALIILRL